ncbi:MAG: hypothetical protein KZQ74_01285 [gamma proteobacterium symbiont of Bathyaustriella thionipta]|nr:hypothetical protein [gamma proteobacterium symbiont of Bathyaustriella thionipta]MCU7951527.1 hypothetical protein [gamma proteobacterium symbiont of Bathyaustriella thionipta]MCU7958100.1 hypothetical protein [gamma proteobacterium symbiont of Bathyaustriella thionipta]MCU7965839.1 hypothetical protein [gamma proteobacterium symbiont of Bathyaustriella thionipta]
MDWLEKSISKQRNYIENILVEPLSHIANICADNWHNQIGLDLALKEFLEKNSGHRCRKLYAIKNNGLQHSSSISDDNSDDTIIGRDLSTRPYLDNIEKSSEKHFFLSEVYIDKQSHKPCITALHSIQLNNVIQGYIAADFGLKDLPLKNVDECQQQVWRQIKGDPSIRSTLFQQTRTVSAMDEHLDEVLNVVEALMTEQGIFHSKLHFSSSRATLWSYDDPYRYRLHVLDEIINPDVCLAYAKVSYPEDALITTGMLPDILKTFKALREADETIYLRAASLNIMNGYVGLNFSCDGTHYMPAEEFLNKDSSFWLGDR